MSYRSVLLQSCFSKYRWRIGCLSLSPAYRFSSASPSLSLSLSFSFSLGPSVSLSLQGSTRSITTTRATYVRAHTLENGRPFISHPTGERTPTNRTLPRAKTSNRTRPSVQRKRGERALRRGGAGRGEMKKSFRIKTGKQKNNQISAYIINEDMCVRACVLVTAPVEGGLGC